MLKAWLGRIAQIGFGGCAMKEKEYVACGISVFCNKSHLCEYYCLSKYLINTMNTCRWSLHKRTCLPKSRLYLWLHMFPPPQRFFQAILHANNYLSTDFQASYFSRNVICVSSFIICITIMLILFVVLYLPFCCLGSCVALDMYNVASVIIHIF